MTKRIPFLVGFPIVMGIGAGTLSILSYGVFGMGLSGQVMFIVGFLYASACFVVMVEKLL